MNGSHSFDVPVEQLAFLHEVEYPGGCPTFIVAHTHLEVLFEFSDIVMRFQQSGPPEPVQSAG